MAWPAVAGDLVFIVLELYEGGFFVRPFASREGAEAHAARIRDEYDALKDGEWQKRPDCDEWTCEKATVSIVSTVVHR